MFYFQPDVNGVQGQGHLVEEEPEEERDHDGDAGGGVGKKPPGLLDKGHLSVGLGRVGAGRGKVFQGFLTSLKGPCAAGQYRAWLSE